MQFKTVAEIYAANKTTHEKFVNTVSPLTQEQESIPSENGKWTIGGIIEHVARVEAGMIQICQKLLSKAKENNESSDGSINLSESFLIKIKQSVEEQQKFEAPEMVQPKGGVPIAESLEIMKQNLISLDQMRSMFEEFDGTKHTFPHPVFGAMTAQDWLALLGGHIARHEAQIKRILAQK